MNFAFSEEQEEFRETLRRFVDEHSPLPSVHARLETREGYDPDLWQRIARELGLQGIHIPEEHGGQGFGLLELGIACEELGRALVPTPFFSSACLATDAILSAGNDRDRQRWLPELASGSAIGTLAVLDEGEEWSAAGVTFPAEPDGEALRLNGHKRFVTAAGIASIFVVAVRAQGSSGANGITLAVVPRDAPGLGIDVHDSFDTSRRVADLSFEGVRAEPLGEIGASGPILDSILDRGRIALALGSCGGAGRCLDMAVAYAKQRIQFARPIGSFQAIKHSLAEVLLEVESARSIAYWASSVASEGLDELALAASVAKSFCDEAYAIASDRNVHIHGGIGVTWEADPHLFVKRARSNETLLGDPRWQRSRVADHHGF
ncbi:MAG: acyl-CoA dehydrogenase family protein [Myxococcota bacterium]|jgi:alkylation response protein AidB-like acyl-CoA dehydrogenase|nr:acyl-CoA dehydrogenase [Deltaproteobacteria bacterium]MCP4240823.1 acyl-CoA/acyl-ACP dehydrogenase [bacterium]MDP6074179.1 acyl-CoA dehydrogenase family protein [Myxococcota bacterium]MDP6242918.1 acyl-CoA dehydrogenase family protein [Myxococcota bacterium]MDP7073194.1 acyl-CoA dehydrogenase family protein [Myxococcota bacterium]